MLGKVLEDEGHRCRDRVQSSEKEQEAHREDLVIQRILVRHGWLDPSSDYDEARSALESIAPDEPERLAQLSLGFEKLGRDFCKSTAPKCDRCPLRPLLPEGGPVEGI